MGVGGAVLQKPYQASLSPKPPTTPAAAPTLALALALALALKLATLHPKPPRKSARSCV